MTNSLLRRAWTLTLCFGFMACRHTVTAVAPPPPPPSGSITLPAGSTLALRTADEIDSGKAALGVAYAAVISRDVNGKNKQMMLPTGSPATLVLLGNSSSWELGLASLTINGDAFLVSANAASAVPLGAYLGGVPANLAVSGAQLQVPSGSLLTFRLAQDITLRDWRK